MATAKKLPSGSWRVRVYDGRDKDGKAVYRSFTAATKKQAEFLAAEYAASKKTASNRRDDKTLAECYARYIEIKRNTLSPATVREYLRAAAHDFPEMMPLRLSRITQEAVQSSVNIMAATHSPKSVRNAHGLLSAVLRMFAPEIRLNTRLPQPKRPDIYVPTEQEVEQLIRMIRGTELEKAVLLAAFGSLRRSEICALTPEDISGNVVRVCKAMVPDKNNCYVIKETTKSEAGTRLVTMPEAVIAHLIPADGAEHIVSRSPHQISQQFTAAIGRAGLAHFRFHDLRHYQASILHAMGVPDQYIMARGGWKTDATLKTVYRHQMDDKRQQVEDDICRFFSDKFKL